MAVLILPTLPTRLYTHLAGATWPLFPLLAKPLSNENGRVRALRFNPLFEFTCPT